MNERIRECWLKAAREDSDEKWDTQEEFIERFARLIVRECIQVAGPEDSYTDEWFKAKVDSVAKIKQHFGVEE